MSLVRASLRSRGALARCPIQTARRVSSTAGWRSTVAAGSPAAAAVETVTAGAGSSSSGSGSGPRRFGKFGLTLAVAPLALVAGGAYLLRPDEPTPDASNITTTRTADLLRAYGVYAICGVPAVVDAAPTLLHAFTHSPIPGLKTLTEFVVRHTFFDQFVAGENLPQCVAAMHDMAARGMGGVLNYSAEAEHSDGLPAERRASEARNFEECRNAIEALGEFERQHIAAGGAPGTSSFAIKLTGLIDPSLLERASTSICRLRPLSPDHLAYADAPFPGVPSISDGAIAAPEAPNGSALASVSGVIQPLGLLSTDAGVTDADMAALHDFWTRLHSLAGRARDLGVKLMVDAEYASMQPIMDAMTLVLSREFNRPTPGTEFKGPVIFGTYQSYLRRAPFLLDAAIRDAEANGYALGIKIVRGAYFVKERKKWATEGRGGADPIWPDKAATDAAYNASVEKIVSTLARQTSGPTPATALSVVFATHNPQSVDLVLSQLERNGLATRTPGPDGVVDQDARLCLHSGLESKVFVAQLYGMRDDLTDRVVDTFEPGPLVALKYNAYGRLDEVLPFLARRAIENKSIMTGEGGAVVERKRVTDELWRRLTR